jgi:hypothetical protein
MCHSVRKVRTMAERWHCVTATGGGHGISVAERGQVKLSKPTGVGYHVDC